MESDEILDRVSPSGTLMRYSESFSISLKIVVSATLSLFQMRYCCLMYIARERIIAVFISPSGSEAMRSMMLSIFLP